MSKRGVPRPTNQYRYPADQPKIWAADSHDKPARAQGIHQLLPRNTVSAKITMAEIGRWSIPHPSFSGREFSAKGSPGPASSFPIQT